MLDPDGPGRSVGLAPEAAELAGVDERIADAPGFQGGLDAVRGEPLRDAVQGDGHAVPAEADPVRGDLDLSPVHAAGGVGDSGRVGEPARLPGGGVEVPKRLD